MATKTKGMNDAQFLALLEKVLPKATPDPRLASAIYEQVAQEVTEHRPGQLGWPQ